MGIDVAAFLELSFPSGEHEGAWRQATARESAYEDVGEGLLAPLGKGRKRVAQTLAAIRDDAAKAHFVEKAGDARYGLELVMPDDAWAQHGSPLHAAARVAAEHEGTGTLRIIGFEGTDRMIVVDIAPGQSGVRAPSKMERTTSEHAIEAIRTNLVAAAEKAASKPWARVTLDRAGIRKQVRKCLGGDSDGNAFRALMGAGEGASQVIVDVLIEEIAHPSSKERFWDSALDVIWRRGERATGARHFQQFFEQPEKFEGSRVLRERTAYAIVSMRDPEGLEFVAGALDGLVASWTPATDALLLTPIVQAVLYLDPVRAFDRLSALSRPKSNKRLRDFSLRHIFPAFSLQDWSTHLPFGRSGGLIEPRDPRWNDHLASWLESRFPAAWEKIDVSELLLRLGDARGLDGLIAALEDDEMLSNDACDALAQLGDARAAAALRAAGRRNKKFQRGYYAAAKAIEQRL